MHERKLQMNISRLNIGPRFGLGFALVLALAVALTAIGISSMREIQHRLNGIVEVNVRKMDLLQQMSESVHIVSRVVRTVVLLDDGQQIDTELKKITDAREHYDAALEAL